jgi:intracellular sulfur oxidation DsrE/DsrF family protein
MQTRADFLAAGSSAAIAAVASPKPSPSATIGPLQFDLAAFDAATAKNVPHKHLFADTKLARGGVLDAVQNTLDAYASLGVAPSQVATVVVLYHGPSLALALDDAVWRDLLVAAIAKAPPSARADLEPYRKAIGNPFLRSDTPDARTVPRLVKQGTLFFVCNNAVKGFSDLLGTATGKGAKAVYERLAGGLLAGATLVPAGVWAIHALQERHYTYLQTSL